MSLPEAVVTIIAGALVAIISSALGAWGALVTLRRDYQNRYRMEIINKQMLACETLWSALSIASKYNGNEGLIEISKKGAVLRKKNIVELLRKIANALNSHHGLYYSKEVRNSVFALRDFIEGEININGKDTLILLSNTKANKLDGYIQNVRIALRRELRAENINHAKEGPL